MASEGKNKRELQTSEQQPLPKKIKTKMGEIVVYGEFMFLPENVKITQKLVKTLLDDIRIRQKIPDDKDFLWTPKDISPLPNFREQVSDSDLGPFGDVISFKIASRELGYEENSNEQILVLRQTDGFSCAGASIFTCTAGYTKIPPSKLDEIHQYVTINNPWGVEGESPMSVLPIEGIVRLIYTTMGIIPTIMYGKVAREIGRGEWEKIDEDDNLFNDEARFVKLMRMVRFAGICFKGSSHWVSLICLPFGQDTAFMVCDSLSHNSSTAYPSYSSLRRHFLAQRTKPTALEPNLHIFPLTMAIYPILQEHQGADPVTSKFMDLLIQKTVQLWDANNIPFVAWKEVAVLLDSLNK
jgi:hypothetical protein